MDTKLGITIGYGLDILGFAVLFFSGGFDSLYKGSNAAIESLENEIKIMTRSRDQVSKVMTQTIATGYGGMPIVGTGFVDYNSLSNINREIETKERTLDLLKKSQKSRFPKYVLKNGKAPLVGFLLVVLGVGFQWWFSSYGAIP